MKPHPLIAVLGGLLATILLIVFIEASCAMPRYVLEPATVRAVVPNPKWHYIAQNEMTLIRFADGFDTDVSGNRGAPGDHIMAYRQRGIDTPFGFLARKE